MTLHTFAWSSHRVDGPMGEGRAETLALPLTLSDLGKLLKVSKAQIIPLLNRGKNTHTLKFSIRD